MARGSVANVSSLSCTMSWSPARAFIGKERPAKVSDDTFGTYALVKEETRDVFFECVD